MKKNQDKNKIKDPWTDECEELLAEWSEKQVVIGGYMEEVKKVIKNGIIVFQYQLLYYQH